MTYQDTVQWMFKQLPMYQNEGKTAYKANLDNTLRLAEHLQHPENNFKSVHVAGTNGKGSTSHMLASILQEAGYKVGLYTSPHLKDFRERIKINGQEINEAFVVEFVVKNKSFFESHELSFFEMTVGMAFEYFSEEKVDIAIIEVGMGGRLDSTNIITPEVSVITNIGLDHTQFLGHTLEAIAVEKAGIIKHNVPIVIGETQVETEAVFQNIAKERLTVIHFADQKRSEKTYESDLKGEYQLKNKTTVLAAIEILRDKAFEISEKALADGFKNVVKNTGLNGRWQILQEAPKVICDTAHNKEGLHYAMSQLLKEQYEQLHMVFGVVSDKDISTILPLLPQDAIYYFCKPNIARGFNANDLRDVFRSNGFIGESYSTVLEALGAAKQQATTSDVIYIGGSTFVVGEII